MPDYTIWVNSFEVGAIMGLIENLDPQNRKVLDGVRQQLVVILKDIEDAAGVVKGTLPDGRVETTDAVGNRIVRPPYSWEREGD